MKPSFLLLRKVIPNFWKIVYTLKRAFVRGIGIDRIKKNAQKIFIHSYKKYCAQYI